MYSSLSVTTIVVSVVLPLLAIFAATLRFIAQRPCRKVHSWTFDEALIILNCILLVGSGCLTIVGACVGGIGADLRSVDSQTIKRFRKIDFVSEFFYISTVGIPKLSLLLYYRRIFMISSAFRKLNTFLLGLVGLWMLTFYITTIIQGLPVSWNWTGVGHSIDLHSFFIAEAASDIALDLMVLCLPVIVVRGLQMSFNRKAAVVCIMGLGAFCLVAASIRLYYVTRFFQLSIVLDPQAFLSTVTNLDLWSLIEPCSTTIFICLPCMGPLFRGGRSPTSLVNSWRSAISIKSTHSFRNTEFVKVSAEIGGQSTGSRSYYYPEMSIPEVTMAECSTNEYVGDGGLAPLHHAFHVKSSMVPPSADGET